MPLAKFNILYNEYNKKLIHFAHTYVRDRVIAEDLVSDAFITLWENKDKLLLPEINSKAYLLTIVKNNCLNYLRRLQRTQKVENELTEHVQWRLNITINSLRACDPNFIFSTEIEEIINATINRLPNKTKQIFILSRFQNLSYKEIAERKNLSVKSIEYHISNALKSLRNSLKEFYYLFI